MEDLGVIFFFAVHEMKGSNDEMGCNWDQWYRREVLVIMDLCLIVDNNTIETKSRGWHDDFMDEDKGGLGVKEGWASNNI